MHQNLYCTVGTDTVFQRNLLRLASSVGVFGPFCPEFAIVMGLVPQQGLSPPTMLLGQGHRVLYRRPLAFDPLDSI